MKAQHFAHGSEDPLSVSNEGRSRALVRFPLEPALAALPQGSHILSATLSLDAVSNGGNWGSGRDVGIHRMTRGWTEAGATWNCASDANPSNSKQDCAASDQWDMMRVRCSTH